MRAEPFRILLVEDNPADVYLLRKALESAGLRFELTVIADGASALKFVRGDGAAADQALPDITIVDLSLPKNDGIQVVECIRGVERFAGLPVVVMSSLATPPARLKQEHLHVSHYIAKSPDLDQFLRTGLVIRQLLEGQARRAGQ